MLAAGHVLTFLENITTSDDIVIEKYNLLNGPDKEALLQVQQYCYSPHLAEPRRHRSDCIIRPRHALTVHADSDTLAETRTRSAAPGISYDVSRSFLHAVLAAGEIMAVFDISFN